MRSSVQKWRCQLEGEIPENSIVSLPLFWWHHSCMTRSRMSETQKNRMRSDKESQWIHQKQCKIIFCYLKLRSTLTIKLCCNFILNSPNPRLPGAEINRNFLLHRGLWWNSFEEKLPWEIFRSSIENPWKVINWKITKAKKYRRGLEIVYIFFRLGLSPN